METTYRYSVELFPPSIYPHVLASEARTPHAPTAGEIKTGHPMLTAPRTRHVVPHMIRRHRCGRVQRDSDVLTMSRAMDRGGILREQSKTPDAGTEKVRRIGLEQNGIASGDQRRRNALRHCRRYDDERRTSERRRRTTDLGTVAIGQYQLGDDD